MAVLAERSMTTAFTGGHIHSSSLLAPFHPPQHKQVSPMGLAQLNEGME